MGKSVDATVELSEGMAFRATTDGHTLLIDAASEIGGQHRGPGPMQLLLLGLGGCMGMTVISILRKMQQDVTGYHIALHGEQAEEHPKVFTTIAVEHVIRGRNLNRALVERAIERAANKYCPASAMLGEVAHIEERYRLVDEATGGEA